MRIYTAMLLLLNKDIYFKFSASVKEYFILEINPCGLGFRIQDMEAEWRLRVITDKISWRIFGKQNWQLLRDGPNVGLKCQSVG